MKKIYLLVLSATFCHISKGQLTLTKALNEPVISDTKNFAYWDSTTVLNNSSGTGVMWNFSNLTTNTAVASASYVTVASTPSAATYPNATFAESDGFGGYTYWKSTSTPTTQLEFLGMIQPSLSINLNSNSGIAVIWPVSMGYNKTDAFSGTAAAQTTIALTGTASGNIKTMANGTGTLMLPGNLTFTNVLQITSTQTINISLLFGFVTATIVNTNYQYYHSSQKFPLLTVEYQSTAGSFTGTTAAIKINSNVINVPTTINESNLNSNINMYPNPIINNLTINLSNNKSEVVLIEITNSLGQIVKTTNLGNSTDINQQIDLSELNKGIYFVKTKIGNNSSSKKLIKE